MSLTRRGSLQSAGASLGVTWLDPSLLNTATPEDLENTFNEIRANLFEMINEERAAAKVQPLAVDSKTPGMSWLTQPRSYSLPNESKVLRPKVPPPLRYADGTPGVVETSIDGRLSTKVRLFRKEPGIYTIVTWLKRGNSGKSIPRHRSCIEAS